MANTKSMYKLNSNPHGGSVKRFKIANVKCNLPRQMNPTVLRGRQDNYNHETDEYLRIFEMIFRIRSRQRFKNMPTDGEQREKRRTDTDSSIDEEER